MSSKTRPANSKNPTSIGSEAAPHYRLATRTYLKVMPLSTLVRRIGDVHFSHERFRGLFADPHAHDGCQLIVPLSGRTHISTDTEQHLLGPESAILIPAGVRHATRYLDGEYDYFSILAPQGWLEAIARDLAVDLPRDRAWTLSEPALWPLARHLASELGAPGAGAERLLMSSLELLGLWFVRGQVSDPAPDRAQDPRILRALDRMLRDYGEDLRVEGLASEALMTPRHFERRFKEVIGLSPRRYLIGVRMAIARQLLETTDWAIADVAAEVGFNQPSYFIAAFRKAHGVTPAAYRKTGPRSISTRGPAGSP